MFKSDKINEMIFTPSLFQMREKTQLFEKDIICSDLRIIKRNLVYVSGITNEYANTNLFSSFRFFGKFGNIKKLIVNTRIRLNESIHLIYITYIGEVEAKRCIRETDGSILGGKVIRCTYGTSKYCTFFLKGVPCQNTDCMYLHEFAAKEDILSKEDLGHMRTELHDFETINHGKVVLGLDDKYEFLDELLRYKKEASFKPPSRITFKPLYLENEIPEE